MRLSAMGRYAVVCALISACGTAPVPSGADAPEPLGSTFHDGGIEFGYPASWNAATFEETSSFSSLIVYLSTDELRDRCVRDGFSISCEGAAVRSLGPNGVFVSWQRHGFPGWELDQSAGRATVVGGRRGVVLTERTCEGIGGPNIAGAQQISVQIEVPGARWNWVQMDACLAGPNPEVARAEVDAMLRTVVWVN